MVAAGTYLVLSMLFSKKKTTESCKTHKWVYIKQPGEESIEFLVCSACNKMPSEIVNEGI